MTMLTEGLKEQACSPTASISNQFTDISQVCSGIPQQTLAQCKNECSWWRLTHYDGRMVHCVIKHRSLSKMSPIGQCPGVGECVQRVWWAPTAMNHSHTNCCHINCHWSKTRGHSQLGDNGFRSGMFHKVFHLNRNFFFQFLKKSRFF